MKTSLTQAIDLVYPDLDSKIRNEIKERVTGNMLEFLKHKVFDESEQASFDNEINQILDPKQKSENYGRKIMEKLLSLPEDTQKQINGDLDLELIRVMNKIDEAIQG